MTSSTSPEEKPPAIAVIAFGGNALLRKGQALTMENQIQNAAHAAAAVAHFIAATNNEIKVCITHGNGPQVGLLAQMDTETGLDVLDAETEGQIGYLLELEMSSAFHGQKDVAAILTQIAVDPEDAAFQHPTKPIGRWYSKEQAEELKQKKGWSIAQIDDGSGGGDQWRRVVASPEPKQIMESRAIEVLLKNNVIVIACGGGGIPIILSSSEKEEEGSSRKSSGSRRGVQAVIDKDAASALLAADLGAQWLIMLTDAESVFDPEKWPQEKIPLPSPITCAEVERRTFAAGSMGPKMAAACSFVKRTGGRAAVGQMDDLVKIYKGEAGTVIIN